MATSNRLTLDTGLSCHYLEWDRVQSDHTVVLVHGFLEFGGGFKEMVECGLDNRFHVIAPDMRGHGDSGRVGDGGYYHFLDYLADLRSFIERVGRERISLVGHSMGGTIASYYAGTFPSEVHRLVLMEGLGLPDDPTPIPERIPTWIRGWKRARQRSSVEYADLSAAADRLMADDPLLTRARAEALVLDGTKSADDPDKTSRYFKHDPLHVSRGPIPFSLHIAEQFWARVTCPVLVFGGQESTFRLPQEEIDRRLKLLGNTQTVVLPGAGHVMQRHVPQELATRIEQFLGDA